MIGADESSLARQSSGSAMADANFANPPPRTETNFAAPYAGGGGATYGMQYPQAADSSYDMQYQSASDPSYSVQYAQSTDPSYAVQYPQSMEQSYAVPYPQESEQSYTVQYPTNSHRQYVNQHAGASGHSYNVQYPPTAEQSYGVQYSNSAEASYMPYNSAPGPSYSMQHTTASDQSYGMQYHQSSNQNFSVPYPSASHPLHSMQDQDPQTSEQPFSGSYPQTSHPPYSEQHPQASGASYDMEYAAATETSYDMAYESEPEPTFGAPRSQTVGGNAEQFPSVCEPSFPMSFSPPDDGAIEQCPPVSQSAFAVACAEASFGIVEEQSHPTPEPTFAVPFAPADKIVTEQCPPVSEPVFAVPYLPASKASYAVEYSPASEPHFAVSRLQGRKRGFPVSVPPPAEPIVPVAPLPLSEAALAAKSSESDVQKSFDKFNKALLNSRKNRRSSLNIRFGIRAAGSPRHQRHGANSPSGSAIFQTPPKKQTPPEQNLTPTQRRKLHEEQENEKIADLLAQTNKRWIGNNFETLLIDQLPEVVERQPLNSVGTLLDASAKIYAYKVDKTLQDCCHAKRDIEKPEKNARKLEKLAQLAAEEGIDAETAQDYADHKITQRDLFRHVTSIDDSEIAGEGLLDPIVVAAPKEYSDEEEAAAAFKMPEEFSLFKKTKKRRRPAGAPDSDDDQESVKHRNEKIRQHCFKITQNPRMKLTMSDSSDEECSLRERDAKLYDFFECVQFRNSLVQQGTKKLIMKETDYDPEADEKELFNPRYSKTVRTTGATSASLMLNNVVSDDQGSIMLLHTRPFPTLHKYKPRPKIKLPNESEINAHCDFAGTMQQVLEYDRRVLRHLFPSVKREHYQEAMVNRKARSEAIKKMKDQFDASDSAASGTGSCPQWRDQLIDPRLFRDDSDDDKPNARKGSRKDKKKKKKTKATKHRKARFFDDPEPMIQGDDDIEPNKCAKKPKEEDTNEFPLEEMEVDAMNSSKQSAEDRERLLQLLYEGDKLETPKFSEKEVEQQRRNINSDFLADLTNEDAKALGISDKLLALLRRDGNIGVVSDEAYAAVSDLFKGNCKNAMLEAIFGSNFDNKELSYNPKLNSDNFKSMEKHVNAVRYNFTEDYSDLDGMWHCEPAVFEQGNRIDEIEDQEKHRFILARGSAEDPLFWDQDYNTMRVRKNAPGKFRRVPLMKKHELFTVRNVPKLCDIRRVQADKFFEDDEPIEQCNMAAAFQTLDIAFGDKDPIASRANNIWKASGGYRPLRLEEYDFEEAAHGAPRLEERRILDNGDDILMTEEVVEYDYTDPPLFPRYDDDDNPTTSGVNSDDILNRFQKGEDLDTLLKKDRVQPTKETAAVPKTAFGDQALGELLTGDADHVRLPHMIDDSHWKAAQPEPEVTKKRKNKVLEAVEKDFCDKDYWEEFDSLPTKKPPRKIALRTINYPGVSWRDENKPDYEAENYVSCGRKRIVYTDYECVMMPSSYSPFYGTWPKGRVFSLQLVAEMTTYHPPKLEICVAFTSRKEREKTPPTFADIFGKYSRSEQYSPSRTVLETYPEDRRKNKPMEGIEEESEEPLNEEQAEAGDRAGNPAECQEPLNNDQPQDPLMFDENDPTDYNADFQDDFGGEPANDAPGPAPLAQASVSQPQKNEEDEDEMFGQRYKIRQSRVNAPLVKKAIAAILANPNADDKGPLPFIQDLSPSPPLAAVDEQMEEDVDIPSSTALLRNIKQEVMDEDEQEQEKEKPNELESMQIRVCDFPVVGNHTFTNLMARLPAFLNKQSVEDLKPSNALTILLHMCNENKLEIIQNRDRKTKGILESSLHDFIIRTSATQ